MNYLDLFSGIGGFALGAYYAGFKCDKHYYSEIEKYPAELYQLRFPDSIPLGDITKIDFEKLKDGNEWIITGGFPCQDISVAGKGAGIEGKRSGLWFEYWRAIRILRPKFAIIENVGAITIRGLDRVLSSLAEIGYNAEWQDIRAEDMGAPHRRERIWVMAYPIDNGCSRESRGLQQEKQQIQDKTRERYESCSSSKLQKQKISNPLKQHDDNTGYGASQVCRERSEKTEIQGCISNPNGAGFQEKRSEQQATRLAEFCKEIPNTLSTRERRDERKTESERNIWKTWSTESDVGRLADGVPRRVDKLKGLGNSIVPQIAELLFKQIKGLL